MIVSVSFNSPEVSAIEPKLVAEAVGRAGVSLEALQSNANASTSADP